MAVVNRAGRPSPLVGTDREAPPVRFVDVASEGGLAFRHVAGGESAPQYILEVTGSGVAVLDYDGDGLQDVFLVNQTRWRIVGDEPLPTSRLYRNLGSLQFEDVTSQARLTRSGWGQGACVGDYDNDGDEDLFVTSWGDNALFRNAGDGTFEEVAGQAGLLSARRRWSTGCSFFDYDRDGLLDLAVANYVRFDPDRVPKPGESELCRYQGSPVVCGPRGLPGESPSLYRNEGDGRFADVSEASGFSAASGVYGFSVLTGDFDGDGWPDVYIACDSTPSILFQNGRDGTFVDIGYESGTALNEHGQEQGGMGVDSGDYNRDGLPDIVKTNFDNDIPSLYRNDGGGFYTDAAAMAGLGVHTTFVGWGVAFLDVDHDGWQDVFIVNGHVYGSGGSSSPGIDFEQTRNLYWNLGNGSFLDITPQAGPGLLQASAARGASFIDLNNDGKIEVVVNNLNGAPNLLVNRAKAGNWIRVTTEGTTSNRDGIGALVSVTAGDSVQAREVRSGGSFLSQNDMRLHFGLGDAGAVDGFSVRWPSGLVESFPGAPVNREVRLKEGAGAALEPQP